MSNKPDDKKPEDENKNAQDSSTLLHFPGLEERKKLAGQKKAAQKEDLKRADQERKEREKMEDEYRRQYRKERAARAQMQSTMARRSAAGKQPFINWDRIPLFSRTTIITFVAIHVFCAFFLDDAQRVALYMNFGFVPAYYSGTLPWTWSALVAPLTTALLHGGWVHLLTNSVMMMAMGIFFERQYGARITLIFFIVSALCGDLVYFILSPMVTTPVVGASGAISGLFGAIIMMMNTSGMAGPQAQKRGPFPLILLWISIMIGMGMLSSDTAWQSHLGGFLGGIALFQLWRKDKVRL